MGVSRPSNVIAAQALEGQQGFTSGIVPGAASSSDHGLFGIGLHTDAE